MKSEGMLQAKPSEKDYKAVIDFLLGVESIFELDEAPEDAPLGFYPQCTIDVTNWITSKWPSVSPSWRRVVFGGKVAIEHACDPSKNHVDWKPEIKAAMDAAKEKEEDQR